MRNYRMNWFQRQLSDIRYFRKWCLGDLAAALATVGIILLAPIIMALGR